MPRLDFWYEFASPYSYLAAMRIERAAAEANVEIAWRPFLLGPIFKAQGWNDSPFNIYPVRGRYMTRDLERCAEAIGQAFRMPDPFPANSLRAARLAMVGREDGWIASFSKRVFIAEFTEHADISDKFVLSRILSGLGLDPDPVLARALAVETKSRLRSATEEAQKLGIFGAPTFVTPDGELFWGNDRLEQALQWAQRA